MNLSKAVPCVGGGRPRLGRFFLSIKLVDMLLLNDCFVRGSEVRAVEVSGSAIPFVVIDGFVWFDVSEFKGDGGKDVEKWLSSEEAGAFMGALTVFFPCHPADYKVQRLEGEVWLHEDMAVEYARWLSAERGIGLRYALDGISTSRRPCMGVIRDVYSQEQTGVLKASDGASVDDGYAVMLPYLFEWIGGYDITVLPVNAVGSVTSGETYLMFKRFLDKRRIPYTEPGLYVTKFLKEIGFPYVRSTGGKGWVFMVSLKERYVAMDEEA